MSRDKTTNKKATKYEAFLEILEGYIPPAIHSADRALWHLLRQHAGDIEELFDEVKDDGYQFHKCFRQIDVTPDGNTDMAIWHLIGKSKAFWNAWEEATKQPKAREAIRRATEGV